jgi:hypothetical protein
LSLLSDYDEKVKFAIHLEEKNMQKLNKENIKELLSNASKNAKILFLQKYKELLLKKFDDYDFKKFIDENSDIFEDILKIYGSTILYRFDSYNVEDMIRKYIKDGSRVKRWLNYLKIGHYYQQQ